LNAMWASFLLAWAASATALAWWLTQGGRGAIGMLDYLDRRSARTALGLILATAIILAGINVLQVQHFTLSTHAEDSAYYNQLLWNTVHGDFLRGNVQQDRLFTPAVSSELA